jgi:hypothetical protein
MPRKLEGIVVPVPSDLDVAQACTPLPITVIAEELGLTPDEYDPHGKLKAKARADVAAARGVAAAGAARCGRAKQRGAHRHAGGPPARR